MDLKVAAIQSDLYWESTGKNLDMFSRKIESIEDVDLIVLPEMFNTGFTMNVDELAESMDGISFHWLKNQAVKNNAVVTGSIIIKEEEKYFNRMIWMKPDESFDIYDKRHLFTMANEHQYFTPGNIRKVVTLKSWRILINVCYDLRFPVWSRSIGDYDAMVYIANWPNKRSHHWSALLRARAIENQSYLIGVNRYGTDGNDFYYSGNSVILNPLGETLAEANDEENILISDLKIEVLNKTRSSLPFLADRDSFKID